MEPTSNAPMTRIDRSSMTVGGILLLAGAVLLGLSYSQSGEGALKAFYQSYVFGYGFWAILSFGCFGLMLLHHTIRGRWGLPVLRIWEAGGGPRMMVLLAVGFVPFILGMKKLYKWADPAYVATDEILQHRVAWMNDTRFIIAAVVYFLFFIALGSLMVASQRRQDASGDEREADKRASWGAVGLVGFFVTMTFLTTDWFMSLEPHWFSTIYTVWIVVGGALAAAGLAAAILGSQSAKAPYDAVVTPYFTKDLGNLMLALTMFWAYVSLSQYLIIWSGNLPEFNQYLLDRSVNGWNVVGAVTVVGGFFIPFLLLLSPRVKRTVGFFAFVGGFIFAMRFADVYQITIPTMRDGLFVDTTYFMMNLGALALVGGAWLLMFGLSLRSSPLLAGRPSPKLQEAHEHV